MSILVVDDIEQNRHLLNVLLTSKGYEVDQASNGEEALNRAKHVHPDLIISDIFMPVMDGFQLCRKCKTDPELCAIPFMFYTATYIENDDKALALSLGADRFLTKPLEHQLLLDEISNAIDKGASAQRNNYSAELQNEDFYIKYSQSLVNKLEKKVIDLEQKNLQLQEKESVLRKLNLQLESHLIESKRSQAALRLSEERFELAVRGSSDGIWDWDIQTGEVYYAPHFMELLGLSDCTENTIDFFENRVHPDDRGRAKLALNEHLQKRKPYNLELRLQIFNGDYNWFHATGQALWDNKNNMPLRMAGSISDITSRKHLQQQLQQAQKLEAIGQLTGGVAHDFNNILAAILGYAELSLDHCQNTINDEKLLDYLEEVMSAGQRARDLVAQMLAYSRDCVESPQELKVATHINEIVKMLRASIPATIDLSLYCDDPAISIVCDPVHLHQLIVNLCINARDALEFKGAIQIQVSRRTCESVYCASCNASVWGEYVEISVQDEAGGLNPELTSKIFDSFFTTKEHGKGTGLGLSTVHNIMHEYNGHIEVHSSPNVSTSFRLLFPVAKAELSDVNDAKNLENEKLGTLSGKIIVVDDEVSLINLAKEFLESWGCEVFALESPQQVLTMLQHSNRKYDLIITDYAMPGMNGIELVNKIRKSQPGIKSIMWSGYNEFLERYKYQESGIQVFLNKPAQPSELFDAVKTVLTMAADTTNNKNEQESIQDSVV